MRSLTSTHATTASWDPNQTTRSARHTKNDKAHLIHWYQCSLMHSRRNPKHGSEGIILRRQQQLHRYIVSKSMKHHMKGLFRKGKGIHQHFQSPISLPQDIKYKVVPTNVSNSPLCVNASLFLGAAV